MIHNTDKITPSLSVQIPFLSPKQLDEIEEFLEEARRVKDEEGVYIVTTLMNAVNDLESTVRNTYRTLSAYRNMIPKLVRIANAKVKEEENK